MATLFRFELCIFKIIDLIFGVISMVAASGEQADANCCKYTQNDDHISPALFMISGAIYLFDLLTHTIVIACNVRRTQRTKIRLQYHTTDQI